MNPRKEPQDRRRARQSMSEAELLALPVSVDLVNAGRCFAMSRDAAYDAAKGGTFPCTVLRVGSRWVVPKAAILRALGYEHSLSA